MFKNLRELVIATGNPGKFKEISYYLKPLGIEIFSLADFDVDDSSLVEDGETYRENAFIKAKFFYDEIGKTVLADDSGIIVDALKDELGVYTRRWGAGSSVSDQEWLDFFLTKMAGQKNRAARFESSICLYDEKFGIEEYFFGDVEGSIVDSLQVEIEAGLPLSSVFIPEGMDKVHSALSIEEKNKISHRGRALKALVDFLTNQNSTS